MKRADLIEALKECLFEETQEIGPDTELAMIDGWDSLGRLRVALLYSEQFGVVVGAKALLQCETVADLVGFIKDKLKD